ncbi:hypothetical protein P691DRAFT_811132 [Macrolepiota fuliginosa MF-IS2]|uniref:Uncharacterized protein n=1 Tax=Macrolepiota fuliginosa MF-IS2 TaxID=1400762 RepID=A0A9P5XIE8_9AGAR|nr:hypothetical protein P691DRAFT_811132 [Macrolepiota fuliginosa MF-IS2]
MDSSAGRSKPLPRLPLRKSSAAMTMETTKSSYASTPSKFYISEQESLLESPRSALGNGGRHNHANTNTRGRPAGPLAGVGGGNGRGGGRGRDSVGIYSPEGDTRAPHLISTNTITYHSNFFGEPEGMEGLGRADPLEVAGDDNGVGGSVGALSPVDLLSPDSDYFRYPASPPSHRNRSQNYSASRSKPVQLEYYEIEGSWVLDASGKAIYRGTGKVEELEEVREEPGDMASEDPVLSPRKSSLEDVEDGLDQENRLARFQEEFDITSPLPPHTTPPPRPRRVDEVVLSPGGTVFSIPKTVLNSGGVSEIGVGRGVLPGDNNGNRHRRVGLGVHVDMPLPMTWDGDVPMAAIEDMPPSSTPIQSPPPPMQEPEEPDLETQMLMGMLEWVSTGIEDIKVLRDYFIRMCAVYFLRKHIDVTYRVETALLNVQSAIDRRRNMPQSHLDIRTAEWQEKFELRLMSFRTTVQRLNTLRRFVEARKRLTEQHLEMLFQKLLAHEMKYTDIAAKLQASYDRLQLRHLHTQLETSYKAEVEARKERKARKRKSFQRNRIEAKAERANLRNEFIRERAAATL